MGGGGKRKRELKCIGGFENGGFMDLRGISLKILFSLELGICRSWESVGEKREREGEETKGRNAWTLPEENGKFRCLANDGDSYF